MGTFDTVYGADDKSAQVKCFGRLLRSFTIGDHVDLDPLDRYTGKELASTLTDFQIAMSDGTFITVVRGRLRCWDHLRRQALPVLDNWGQPWTGMLADGGLVLTKG